MKCKECEAEGKVSRVYPGTATATTAMYWPPGYYDEQGIWVDNKFRNTITQEFKCSNGHEWAISG